MNQNTQFWSMTKRLFALALPMAGSQFINVGSGFLCMAMLAQLGQEVLAASALIFTTQLSIMVTGMSILFSLSVLIGHAYGAKEYSAIGRLVQSSWLVGLLVSIPIILFFWYIDVILIYCGQTPKLTAIVTKYFHAFIFAVIPGFLNISIMQFGYGIHKRGLMLLLSLSSVLVLMSSAYALIFGKFGLPALGVAGLGYATALQYIFFLIIALLCFYYKKEFQQYELFRIHLNKSRHYFQKIVSVGWPISVQMGGEMLSFFVSGILLGWLGAAALSAFQIVNQYYFLIVIPIFALSQASGILIGQACGAKKFDDVKVLSHASIFSAIAACTFVGLIFFFLPEKLASVYIDISDPVNSATLQLTIWIFAIIAFSQVFDGLRNMFIGILRGLFDTRFPMHMSIITIWVIGMPLSYILAFPLNYGAIGFVVGGAIGMLCGVITMYYRWQAKMKSL